ncbi:MAG: DUF3185 family protein [Treponemataceae bacterium]
MARNNSRGTFKIGAVLIIGGLAALVYGYYLYDAASGNVLAGIGKKILGKTSESELRSIMIMVAGGVAALFGAFLAFFRR